MAESRELQNIFDKSFASTYKENEKVKKQFRTIYKSFIEQQYIQYDKRPNVLGIGGFAKVYKGFLHGQHVAIKKFNGRKDDDENKQNFVRESVVSLQLHHPHIVLPIGSTYDPADKTFSLIYEYMNVGNLNEYTLDFEEAVDRPFIISVLRDVADALSYLHDVIVVHMDVKLGNVLLSLNSNGDIVAKLGDLGLALPVKSDSDPEAKIKNIRGTPSWMAPELLNEGLNKHLTPAVDMYSFGMLIWSLFEYENPFAGYDLKSIFKVKASYLVPEITEDVPKDFVPVIQKCWSKDPSDRPSSRSTLNSLNRLMLEMRRRKFLIGEE